MSYCRCACFGNSTIIPLYRPANPANPCLSCTRQFCLDQKLPACVGAETPEEDPDTATGNGGDVEARCFQRDSPKSHVIVIAFLVITSILLAIAGLKQYGIDLPDLATRMGLIGMVVTGSSTDASHQEELERVQPISAPPASAQKMPGCCALDAICCCELDDICC
ncbi:hypothetical protein JCM8202v2_000241 [Rhodotorula sphaerocarpa]